MKSDQEQVLRNKRVLVTGGSNGIGRAVALAFAKDGADVALTYRSDKAEADRVGRSITAMGRRAVIIQSDLSDIGAVEKIFSESIDGLGSLDVLVNNVGTLTRSSFLEITPDAFDLVFDVNVRAPFFLAQKFAANLIREGATGSIVNVSSLSAHVTRSGVSHYQSSKAALNMMSKSLASELAPYGIRVNTVSPGLTKTNANREQWETLSDVWTERTKHIPLGRAGIPEDIAGAIVFLASPHASYITGAEIVVDGGLGIF